MLGAFVIGFYVAAVRGHHRGLDWRARTGVDDDASDGCCQRLPDGRDGEEQEETERYNELHADGSILPGIKTPAGESAIHL
jgi:hypothetical protein